MDAGDLYRTMREVRQKGLRRAMKSDTTPTLNEATQAISSEIFECVNAGGDWKNVEDALLAFAYSIMDRCGVLVK